MADVTFTAIAQPAPACYPSDFNALMQMIANQALRGTVPDNSGGGIFVGSTPPSSSLTQKVWFKIDATGRPFGAYMFYNGRWRKCYTGSIGDIKLYLGAFNGVFDGTGRGIIGGSGPYDEDGWALCNGQNATPNLDGYFPVGAAWNGSTWVSNPDALGYRGSGGGSITIALANLPALNTDFGVFNFTIGSSQAVLNQGTQPNTVTRTVNGTGANTPIRVAPTFIAMALLMFIGYA
jgi:hypothetical protein